jgi:DNA-binding NarL/FixJ family response regulator
LHQSTEFRVVATLGPEEMEQFTTHEPNLDVILINPEIHEQTGLTIIQQLRGAYPRLGIVALSLQANSQACAAALQAGADGYLTKAQLGGTLPAALRQVVRWHQHH